MREDRQKVAFLDLKAQFSDIQKEVLQGVQDVCQSAEFVLGSAVKQFEQDFSDFLFARTSEEPKQNLQEALELRLKEMYQNNHCVGVGNGTDALEIALSVLGLPPKSEVIIPANTYFACAESVINANLVPVIADCQEDGSFLPDEKMLSDKTSAILAVHLYGRIAELSAFEAFAKKHGLKLIEDCAQSHGGVDSSGRAAGSVGDVACFSFYPCKNLGAYGDGGAVVSKDLALVKKAREFSNHGQEFDNNYWVKNRHIMLGRNSRLDSIQAAILSIKLASLEQHNAYRARCAKEYLNHLQDVDFIKLPDVFVSSVWHLFVIECCGKAAGKRDEMLAFLQENGVECGVHYPHALSEIEALKPHARILPTPNASRRARNIISLPIGEHLSVDDVAYVASVIKAFADRI
ncbi:hypothetical protein BKN38_01065 [Helicobacter sp. CLO-3]|uniref:DegT/DnrJ/EryC1/StrS family aminotransferase n=1 Tax=unclassified Helicobacter TaxID=2593540 RepID=UPI000805D8EE|nr:MULTISPECIES: DegT/DnrJ/EryC1/StrS family aminotransferase [unclassified Helicobacter]OBV29518.1 hypothetical protein BA723_05305 [Helicobacter sp. CLO-3]OHU85638.1 hypothetical protein BKN38_01065 [Helicobacter sp. CLO-3]